jgi:hypothetical protein
MSAPETIPLREAVDRYLMATGSSPSLADQVLAELQDTSGALEVLGDAIPYFFMDGEPVVERERFDRLMAQVHADASH